jgi:hypothetical protein
VTDGFVWYAAYGSNLLRARFLAYLEGGTFPGTSVEHRGARDRTPPRDDCRIDLPHGLFFARERSRWGPGGVAFIDARATPEARTVTRAYLVTTGQFEDVVAQENGWPSPRPLPFGDLVNGAAVACGDGWYDLAMHVGTRDGYPVLTFTSSAPASALPRHPPAPAYLLTICRGLYELGLDEAEIVGYLGDVPGIVGAAAAARQQPADG